jgi:ribosomal RNA-processing protein 17
MLLQIREDRKREVEEHVQTIQKILREAQQAGQDDGSADEDDEWAGIPDQVPEEPPLDHEEEYVDEDLYTTVTVESVSVDRHGLHKTQASPPEGKTDSDGEEGEEEGREDKEGGDAKGEQMEGEPSGSKTKSDGKDKFKKKKKKFRYESKFERKVAERKQKAKKARR